MKTPRRFALPLFLFLGFVFFSGCSQLRDDLPTASLGELSVHPEGWADSVSTNFHGKAIRQDWNLKSCQTCHGSDYTGGTARSSCTSCHSKPGGPENCTTCHGSTSAAPPPDIARNQSRTARGVGLHQIHLTEGTISSKVSCSDCHIVPLNVFALGHLDNSAGAEVRFDTVKFAVPSQSYTSSAGTCENSYCHGNFPNGNRSNPVSWTDTSGNGAKCGTCHGNKDLTDPEDRARPKTVSQGGTHPDKGAFGTTKCVNCHGSVVDANLNFVDKAKHIDGKIN